jgi:hypothetical protein
VRWEFGGYFKRISISIVETSETGSQDKGSHKRTEIVRKENKEMSLLYRFRGKFFIFNERVRSNLRDSTGHVNWTTSSKIDSPTAPKRVLGSGT